MMDLQNSLAFALRNMSEVQIAQQQELSDYLEQTVPKNFNPSTELLNLRKIQKTAAKTKQ